MASRPRTLSPVLRRLVKVVEGALGETLAEAEGPDLLTRVERVRRLMVRLREGREAAKQRALADADREIARLSPKQRTAFAQAYTLYLELVNVCENAYRTHRLRLRRSELQGPKRQGANVVYVMTAHPTESRSPENVHLLRRVRALLVENLDRGRDPEKRRLKHLLHLLWRVGTHPRHKPTVADEARYLYSLLNDEILLELLELYRNGHRVRLRTWVGGDKDGHPGVGPDQTATSLALSRQRLISFVEKRLMRRIGADVALIPQAALGKKYRRLEKALLGVRRLGPGDGRRVKLLAESVSDCAAAYRRARGFAHPRLERFQRLLDLFPALVVPLELREERGRFGARTPIAAMLRRVRQISRGGSVDGYVRGLVVSMTLSATDITEAVALVRDAFGSPAIPVIPLFEMPEVMPRAARILEVAMRDAGFKRMVAKRGGRLEVMLGYSDTAKRMGAFPSRFAIRQAMETVGSWGRRRSVQIVFFHGSGGSEGRGGGTIAEQAATWPAAATETIKMTIQGEMVERTLATAEILRSQVLKVAAVQANPPSRKAVSAIAAELAERAKKSYEDLVASEPLKELIVSATPYMRLGDLNIGSRPSKRAKAGQLESLRAIPWVLCWTQTRLLVPVWYGLGAAWRELRRRPGAIRAYRHAIRRDPLLRGFVRKLGFAMAKTEPRIWRRYVRELSSGRAREAARAIDEDYKAALELARRADPHGWLLPDRGWLWESIRHRAPMIHPLNLQQIRLLKKPRSSVTEQMLLRETVTGIAAGMLTTG